MITDAAPRRIGVEVISCSEITAAVREIWTRLQAASGAITPPADPDRFAALTSAMGARPHLAVFRDDESARAIIIGRTHTRAVTCRFGYKNLHTPLLKCMEIVYGGVIMDGPDPSVHCAVVDHLNSMLRLGEVDHIMVNHLSADSPLLAWLRRKLGQRLITRTVEPHWQLDLPGSHEELLHGFSRKHRYNIRRTDRLLMECFGGRVALRLFHKEEELEEFISGTAALAGRTYQAGLGMTFDDTRAWRAILRTEVRNKRLRAYWLECEGRPIAFQLGCVYGSTYVVEVMGYLPEYKELSPGAVLHMRVLADLCAAGIRRVDYGFGDADYKRSYGSKSWNEVTIHIYGHGIYSWLAYWMDASTQTANGVATRLLGPHVKRVKRWWRRRLNRSMVEKGT